MKTRSPERQREMRAYIPMVEQFLTDNDTCQFPQGCPQPATCVHHTRGRRGWRLLYVPWWKASCDHHNNYAETNTGEALACGWLLRIEGT